jgi:ribosomal protein S27AE
MTAANSFEELFRIHCGKCQTSSPMVEWQRTLFGALPANQFQCPKCGYAFARTTHLSGKYWSSFITLDPIQPTLA